MSHTEYRFCPAIWHIVEWPLRSPIEAKEFAFSLREAETISAIMPGTIALFRQLRVRCPDQSEEF